LSQNTSDTNSHRAFKSLLATFHGWDEVAGAAVSQIARPIRAGGLGEVKASYIKQALQEIKKRRGGFNLEFLSDLPVDEAREWLTALPGVGMKTASCVLLFSFGMPAFPVDTHVYRVAGRLGLVDAKAPVEQVHRLLESEVQPGDVYPFHVLLIEHGRKTCTARRPRCRECVLKGLCPSCQEAVEGRQD